MGERERRRSAGEGRASRRGTLRTLLLAVAACSLALVGVGCEAGGEPAAIEVATTDASAGAEQAAPEPATGSSESGGEAGFRREAHVAACLREAGFDAEAIEGGSVLAITPETETVVTVFLGEDATPETAEAVAGEGDVVYLLEGAVAEIVNGEPSDDELAAFDTCYQRVGFFGPDRGSPVSSAPANPDGSFTSICDYVLGDFTESASGFRFIGEATLENTGNIGIVVRVTGRWKQLGTSPVTETKTVKVPVGRSKVVRFSIVATSDQIDLHQAAEAGCSINAKIVDTFGEPT